MFEEQSQVINSLIKEILNRSKTKINNGGRLIIAISGAPGSGKSTLSEHLLKLINSELEKNNENNNNNHNSKAIIVPMDGFHLDNVILEEMGLLARKGSLPTFDGEGFEVLLKRLNEPIDKEKKKTIAIPVFDRSMDLSKAGASIIKDDNRIIIVEGNYLLIHNTEPWSRLHQLFDMTVYLDVNQEVLESRLIQRWLDHGFDREYSINRAKSNDIPNAKLVIENSKQAEFIIKNNGR
eukprot:gene10938-13397_t